MSQMFASPSLELLLIAGRAVALVLGLLMFAWAFRHWRRAVSRDTQRVFEQLDLVRSELLIMKEVMHHAAHRTDAPSQLAIRDSRPVAPAPAGPARGYEIAARMARNGASKDDLIRSCGITSHEAELLIKLHGHRRDSANPFAAELIGRQARMPESVGATAKGQAALNQSGMNQAGTTQSSMGQSKAASRQTAAATETQRTAARSAGRGLDDGGVRNAALQSRSRLVAVG